MYIYIYIVYIYIVYIYILYIYIYYIYIYDILPYILPDDMSELFQNSVSGCGVHANISIDLSGNLRMNLSDEPTGCTS